MRIALLMVVMFACAPLRAEGSHASSSDSHTVASAFQHLKKSHGGQSQSALFVDRIEYQGSDSANGWLIDASAWWGTDEQKLWLNLEAGYDQDASRFDDQEIELLYNRSVAPFWDAKIGLRYDAATQGARNAIVAGFHGLAPYWVETDVELALDTDGSLFAGLEAEYDWRLSQRLVLQSRLEFDSVLAGAGDETGSGFQSLSAEVRLAYALNPMLAVYAGASSQHLFDAEARERREAGGPTHDLKFVAGFSFWY